MGSVTESQEEAMAAWERSLRPSPAPKPTVLRTGKRAKRPYDEQLEKCILDPTDRKHDAGPRGSSLEGGDMGRTAAGRPRGASRRYAAQKRARDHAPDLSRYLMRDGGTLVLCREHSLDAREQIVQLAEQAVGNDPCRICAVTDLMSH